MRGEFATAAPFIGVAIVLDMLDGRIARMTGTTSDFGVQLDSLADLISFGMAPGGAGVSGGMLPLGRLGWAIGFMLPVGGGAPPGALQHPGRAPVSAISSACRARPRPAFPAATVFYFPAGAPPRTHRRYWA